MTLMEWLTVIAAGDGVEQGSGAAASLVAAIGERRVANGRRIEPYQRAVDPGPAGAAEGAVRRSVVAATWR